ncbi:hypothetical protein RHSIM_Rhsim02G0100300 [Rhododendron simsii]|uniref:HAT C-terminal dimerisation domain-containing protein n=1 Tax=Rhododendron simsii TaxID=118357 RepID=A0A834HD11_RHOSS|nr:hypothetical protein RHSIM_Rhsim02G0100300 [Rhododendron simsii]
MAEEDSGFKTFFGIKEGDDRELASFGGGETIELVSEGGQVRSHRVQRIPTKLDWKEVAEEMEKRVKGVLDKLYDAYANEGEVRVQVASATPSVVVDEDCDDRLSLASEFDTYLEQEYSSICSSEVYKYVNDLCERKDIPDFDILLWWKNNSNKYPILSQVARDVLAMPVSTVASKSAFSMCGHVLDPFRSLLSLSMVKTLVCTQN